MSNIKENSRQYEVSAPFKNGELRLGFSVDLTSGRLTLFNLRNADPFEAKKYHSGSNTFTFNESDPDLVVKMGELIHTAAMKAQQVLLEAGKEVTAAYSIR